MSIPDLDVLTIVSPNTPCGWVAQCRHTVAMASSLSGLEVRHLETPYVAGNVGAAMAQGLAQSTAPYVAWVDDDDFVLPNAFLCLKRHLPLGHPAVCAREINLYMNGNVTFQNHRHHLTAWRRDVLDLANLSAHPGYPLVKLLADVGTEAVDELSWVYMRRRRQSDAMKVRGAQ